MKESDYDEAVSNFYEGLYAFGYSLTGKEDDASELTQETFYRLLTRGAMVRDASKVKSWLFTTLYRIFLGWQQRRALLPHFEIGSVENELAPVTPDQMDVLLDNAMRDSLKESNELARYPATYLKCAVGSQKTNWMQASCCLGGLMTGPFQVAA